MFCVWYHSKGKAVQVEKRERSYMLRPWRVWWHGGPKEWQLLFLQNQLHLSVSVILSLTVLVTSGHNLRVILIPVFPPQLVFCQTCAKHLLAESYGARGAAPEVGKGHYKELQDYKVQFTPESSLNCPWGTTHTVLWRDKDNVEIHVACEKGPLPVRLPQPCWVFTIWAPSSLLTGF